MEISFADQNDADVAARREKLLARLNKRRTAPESQTMTKKTTTELDDLFQKASEDIEAKKVSPQIIENLEKLMSSSAGRVLKRIQDSLEELRKIELSHSESKKTTGFSFVRQTAPVKPVELSLAKPSSSAELESMLAPVIAENVLEILNKTDAIETITGEDGTSVSIKDLHKCVLRFAFSPSAVHIKNIQDCILMFPEIDTSILMYGVCRCKIFAVAQQIRVHDAVDLELHVYVKGAVILEGCTKIAMAPYNLLKNGRPICASSSDQWQKPVDFDWLSSEPSPNFSILKEDLWIKKELL